MENLQQIEIYILLFSIIVIIGQIFNKIIVPISILLFIAGMFLSFIPYFPKISIEPSLVLHFFLPLLIYQISSFSSWHDFKKNMRPITLLSVGHVMFITITVAFIAHRLIPEFSWPLCFVLGAVISPPDDVAIVTIAQKIRLPQRVITILEGEGLFNDATALILFRFAVAALITHQFSMTNALFTFFAIIIGETIYGFMIGELLGQIRIRIKDTSLHTMASLLTPFFAFLPPYLLGGSGILSTVITGFIIGTRFVTRFTPEFRLVSYTIWPMIAFTINCLIFLLVGLNMRSIVHNISPMPFSSLALYSSVIIATVILGRFVWVIVGQVFLPRFLFPSILKKDPYPAWQQVFLICWSGMRGSVSLAAALAVPLLPNLAQGTNPRDLLIFIVFSVIVATFLIQGSTLPWIMKLIHAKKFGEQDAYNEHVSELMARTRMTKAVLKWLKQYRKESKEDNLLCDQLKLSILEYKNLLNDLKSRVDRHQETLDDTTEHDDAEENRLDIFLKTQIIEVERSTLLNLWRNEKISLPLRNKLLEKLDHKSKQGY